MQFHITVADVDSLLGADWTAADNKARAVLIANVWLRNQNLRETDPMPDEFKQAGAEIAREAAYGRIYAWEQTGILSQSASAGDVSSSKTFSSTARMVTAGERLALALIKPWLPDAGVLLLKRL